MVVPNKMKLCSILPPHDYITLPGTRECAHWVVGALITQSFSVAGDNDRRVTAPFGLQPFINYNLPHGWAISTSPTFTADWQAGGSHAWTVPVGGSIARTMIVAKQPLTLALAAYYNVDKPLYQADYQIRLTLTFMFPSK